MLDFLCSSCHMQLSVSPDRAGRRVKCPYCAAPSSVPVRQEARPGVQPGLLARGRVIGAALAAVLGRLLGYGWAR